MVALVALQEVAAAAGLIVGIWLPYLGLVTSVALVAYFVIAIAMHIRARDFGRNRFVNATGMLALCVGTLVWSFLL
ncbi:MAG: DoxX family protein [Micromonosporaceae bacterium]